MNRYLIVVDGKEYIIKADSFYETDALRLYVGLQPFAECVAVFARYDGCLKLDAEDWRMPEEGQTE